MWLLGEGLCWPSEIDSVESAWCATSTNSTSILSDCVLVHANNYDIVTFLFSIIIIVGGASITPHVCNNAVDVHMQQDNIIMCRRLFIKRHAHFDHSCVYSSSLEGATKLKSIYTVLLLLRCPIIFSDSGRKP